MRAGLPFSPAFVIAFLVMTLATAEAEDLATALDRAHEAAQSHRYADVIAILTPFNSASDPESRYITAAEIGRAYFHLGSYQLAHHAFREAVSLHPERAETAIYLEATSYLLGEREQALAIFREVLASGAKDLYLAVTLPGERQFLTDPEVRSILAEHTVPLEVDPQRGSVMGVTLGEDRKNVATALSARSADPTAPTLTASAGPAFIWGFVFDAEQRLVEIVLQTENLLRYTPYRLHMSADVDWRPTPATAASLWGLPTKMTTGVDHGVEMTWDFKGHQLILDFARPRVPGPVDVAEGAAALRSLRLVAPDRMDR